MFKIYGGNTEFNQWEQGKLLTNKHMTVGDRVLFRSGGGKTIPVDAKMKDGTIAVDVPNELLTRVDNITVDLVGKTGCRTTFMVNPCECPPEYAKINNIPKAADEVVKSVLGIAPDRNGNVNIEGYPHKYTERYTETSAGDAVYSGYNDAGNHDGCLQNNINNSDFTAFVLGDKYIVNAKYDYDVGYVDFVCEVVDVGALYDWIDDGTLGLHLVDEDGVSRGVIYAKSPTGNSCCHALSCGGGINQSVTISKVTTTVKEITHVQKIDSEYLPDGVPHIEMKKYTKAVTANKNVYLENHPRFYADDSITITIDGVKHDRIAYEKNGDVFVGDLDADGWTMYVAVGTTIDGVTPVYFHSVADHTVDWEVPTPHIIDYDLLPEDYPHAEVERRSVEVKNMQPVLLPDFPIFGEGEIVKFELGGTKYALPAFLDSGRVCVGDPVSSNCNGTYKLILMITPTDGIDYVYFLGRYTGVLTWDAVNVTRLNEHCMPLLTDDDGVQWKLTVSTDGVVSAVKMS